VGVSIVPAKRGFAFDPDAEPPGRRVFITPWTREFGWNRATTAGLVSAFYFSAPFIVLGAFAIKRFGAVRLLAVGIVLEAVSVCLLPLTNALWQMAHGLRRHCTNSPFIHVFVGPTAVRLHRPPKLGVKR